MTQASFPAYRPRRLRRGAVLREVLAEVRLSPADLIQPIFVSSARKAKPVSSMPGVSQLPVDEALQFIERYSAQGLRQFILFGVTPEARKDAVGSYAQDPDAPVNALLQAVRGSALREKVVMYADLCLCEYADHGHCGAIAGGAGPQERNPSPGSAKLNHPLPAPSGGARVNPAVPPEVVDNDRTLELLGATAVAQAKAGADVVAPSGMMDGQVGAIRAALDQAGFAQVAILAYSVKYASSLYGPFREAGEGGMKFGDRKGYQMDYRRAREWRTELETDLAQGADMVMVKPAAAYLDIIHQVRQACSVPVVGYHVSGEYAMLHAAAQKGWLDLKAAAIETTTAIRRAGADLVISYFGPQMVEWLA